MAIMTGSITRTYMNAKRNIFRGSELTVDSLISEQAQKRVLISNKNAADAELLTKFFQELKVLNSKDGDKTIIDEELGWQMLSSIPKLNFSKSGTSFEKEFIKLFRKYTQGKEVIKGTSTGYATIQLGTKDKDMAEKLVEEIISDIPEKMRKKISLQLDGKSKFYTLKIGAERAGKIDVKAGSKSVSVLEIDATPNAEMERVIELLKTSSFSIKSYATNSEIEFGRTNPQKAVSAVTNYVADQMSDTQDQLDVLGAGIYFVHHPENDGSDKHLKDKNNQGDIALLPKLYSNYHTMIRIYELTGIGLRYDDISKMLAVDFLLVNRAGQNNIDSIKVFSVNELLTQLQHQEKIKIAI